MNTDELRGARGLRRYRRLLKLRQTDLAWMMQVSRAAVMRWEDPRDACGPSLVQLARLGRGMGVELVDLVELIWRMGGESG